MTYHLLTGATGLLGSYLLRDCLRQRHRLAVLVRPAKRESARERIESILSRCEAELRTTLPRPVVIEGELTEADLGLDAAGLRWISRHCRSVIHNAANLTFHGNGRQGEPWHTNFEGTRRILDLCRTTGIRQFHYISTAYVCGLREGRVLETELDVGQTPGNDYEHSKIEAEKLVRAAHWIDPPTIYRPAIIVGDSQTGYTATFHGFYVLVKLAHTLVSRMVRGSTAGRLLVQGLGLSGEDCKNLVPVDWVSAVFTHIFSRPEHHGRTYHLVTRRPPSLALIADVIQEAVEEYSELADEKDAFSATADGLSRAFGNRSRFTAPTGATIRNSTTAHRAAAVAAGLSGDGRRDAPEIGAVCHPGQFRPGANANGPPRLRHPRTRAYAAGPPRPAGADLTGNHCLGLDVSGPGGGQWKLLLTTAD